MQKQLNQLRFCLRQTHVAPSSGVWERALLIDVQPIGTHEFWGIGKKMTTLLRRSRCRMEAVLHAKGTVFEMGVYIGTT